MIYTQKKRKQAYQAVIKRDKVCVLCSQQIADVHHIVGRRNGNDSLKNLIGLCRSCHTMVESDLRYWRPKLIELNERHYGTITIKDLKKKGRYDGFKF